MLKQFVLFTTLVFLILAEIHPQQNVWINYANTNRVTALLKEGDNIWIGTAGGLIKLNTVTNEEVLFNKTTNGFPGNYITSIKKMPDGKIRIGTKNGGLGKFDGKSWTSVNMENSGLPVDYITAIEPGDGQELWAATWGGGLVKTNNSGLIIYNTINSVLPSDFIRCIVYHYESGAVCMGTLNLDLFCFNGYNGSFLHNEWYNFNITALIIDDQNYLLIANDDYLSGYYLPNWNEHYHYQLPEFLSYINTISVDSNNNKWLGSRGKGVFMLQDSIWIVYNTDNSGLPGNDVRAVLADGQTEWIGTLDGGLVKFNGTDWQPVNTNTSAPFLSGVSTFFTDDNNVKLIGFREDGVWIKDNSGWINFNSENSGLSDNYVTSVIKDNSGNYWFGTYNGGMNKLEGANWTNYNTSNSGLSDSNIIVIQEGSGGNLWIATWGGGLNKFDGINWTVYNSSNSGLTDDYIFSMYIDNFNNIWLGTFGSGLFRFDGTDWQTFNTDNSLIPSDYISDIKSDKSNNLWIATWANGAAKYSSGSFTTFNSGNTYFPIDYINCLTADESNNIYIGTRTSGLVKFAADDSLNESWELFDKYNSGMIDNEVSALGKDNEGNIWIGFEEGIAVFNPDAASSVKNDNTKEIPDDFILFQNYPNPFNPKTTIKFSISKPGKVKLTVYSVLGEEVSVLINKYELPGTYSAVFDGSRHSSGIYIYTLTARNKTLSKKLILLK